MLKPNITAALAAGLCLAASIAHADPEITREGVGERRAALDKMELTPFDQGLWSGLADWRLGEAVDAASTRGKVVLVYTFSGYLPTAVRPISIVNRLAERYGDRGLVVVGIHSDEAYEEGVATAEKRRVSFPIARDTGNAFRAAMKVDQDPDFYVIDRAGRLRYADIETASLERAVAGLIGESTDAAEGLLDRMASADALAAEQARRSARLRSQINLSDLPWVPFAQPSAAAYEATDWPEMDTGEDNNRRRGRRGRPTGPVKIDLTADLDWRPGKPTNTAGRATLIYIYTDKVLEELNRFGVTPVDLFNGMNQVQAAHPRDLIVIGAMTPSIIENNRRRRGQDDDAKKRQEDAEKLFDQLAKELPVNHIRVNDYAGSFVTSKITPNNGEIDGRRNSRDKSFIYPYNILVSSDGTVRWHGSVTTSRERAAEWEAALRGVLDADPGIKARHEAEQAYIKSKTD
jgi:peroxiredoxin